MLTTLVSSVFRYNLTSREYDTPSGTVYIELLIDCTQPTGTLLQANLEEDTEDPTLHGAGIYLRPLTTNEQDWSDREFFCGLASIELKFFDSLGLLQEALLSPSLKTERTRVIVWLKKYGSSDFKNEASGIIDIQSFRSTKDKAGRDSYNSNLLLNIDNEISVKFNPDTEKLALIPVQLEGNWNNQLDPSYVLSETGGKYLITEVITNFLKKVNPSITVNFFNNWNLYYGDDVNLAGSFEDSYVSLITVFKHYTGGGNWEFSHENYLQTLKAFLLGIGMFIIFRSEDEADVYTLLDRPLSDTIDDDDILSYEELVVQERRIKYITAGLQKFTGQIIGTAGTQTGLTDDELNMEAQPIGLFRSNSDITNTDILLYIESEFIPKALRAEWLMNYYGTYYLNPLTCRRDKIIILGLYGCEIFLEHNGFYYLPIRSTKKYQEYQTEFIAIPFRPAQLYTPDGLILFDSEDYKLITKDEVLS